MGTNHEELFTRLNEEVENILEFNEVTSENKILLRELMREVATEMDNLNLRLRAVESKLGGGPRG